MSLVDLRSDTVTRPTAAMRAAMAGAEVGDDVWGEDPTAAALEAQAAELLGKEAALFVPSGTMANQIALLLHCRPGDEVIVGRGAHTRLYESGAGAAWAGVQFAEVGGADGTFTADDVERGGAARPIATCRARGWSRSRTRTTAAAAASGRARSSTASSRHARARGLALHLDGARIWNAAVATGVPGARPGGAVRHRVRLLLEGPRRAGRLGDRGRPRRCRTRAPLPQDARRRHAPGRHPVRGGAVRARAPPRATRRRSRQRAPPRRRPGGRRGRPRGRRQGRHQHRDLRGRRACPRSRSPGGPRRAPCACTRSRPPACAPSPTSTSTRPASIARSPPCAPRPGGLTAMDRRRPTRHRRRAAAEARLRAGAAPPDGRVLQLRDLVLDHLHPRRRHHVVPARGLRGRRRRGRHRLAGRRRVLADRRAVHGRRSRPRFPTAGGLYHWSSILGGKGWGWATAWFNLGGLVFVTAAVNVGGYNLFVNFIGPMVGIDPTQLGTGHQIAGVALISLSHALLNHFGIRVTTLLTDFSGWLILAVALLLTARDAARRARPRHRPPVHLRRQRRRGGRRRLAGGARPRHDDAARADVADLHGHRVRRVRAHVRRDRAGRAQRPEGDPPLGLRVGPGRLGDGRRRSCSRCPTSPTGARQGAECSPG